jgi:predicted  nucleic acid-binding Zn-ribbon protein
MKNLFLAVLGVSFATALVLIVVMQKQDSHDKKQAYETVTIQKHIAEFNEDFATDQKNFAETKEERDYYEKKADKHGVEIAQIEFERETAREEKLLAKRKTEQMLEEMDEAVDSLDEKDFDKDFGF